MITKFRTLFIVNISHAYYISDCKDFDFIFPSDTAQLLRNGKLISKVLDGKLYVLFETDESGSALISFAGKRLRIGLKLLNPFFCNFTELPFKSNASTPVYRNTANPAALDNPEEVVMVGQVFSQSLTNTERPVTVTLKNTNGQILQTDIITAANNRTTVSYELTGQVAGTYTVEEADSGEPKRTTYYCDAELRQHGVFGVIEIEIGSGFYITSPTFVVAFNVKEEILKYYIVARNYSDTEFNQLSVQDNGFAEEGRPQVNFTKVLSTSFTNNDISPALLGGSDTKVVLCKTQAAIKRREKARKKIQLNKNGDVVITHLPQPGVDKANGDLIINISKPKP